MNLLIILFFGVLVLNMAGLLRSEYLRAKGIGPSKSHMVRMVETRSNHIRILLFLMSLVTLHQRFRLSQMFRDHFGPQAGELALMLVTLLPVLLGIVCFIGLIYSADYQVSE